MILFSAAVALLGTQPRQPPAKPSLTRRRVPDPPSGVPLRLVPLLLHRPRSLYVAPRQARLDNSGQNLTHPPVYIFIGSLILGDSTWFIITGSIVGIIGVVYVALEFVPSVEPPANMREADAGWGAEGV